MKKFNFKFYHWEKTTPDAPFLRQPFGDKWEVYTWKEAGEMARKVATGLHSLGFPPKSHIGLVSKNCREWVIADLAIMMAGYVSVPFYPTLKADSVGQLIEAGDVKALFAGKLDDWEGMKDGVPEGMPVIRFPHYKGCSEIKEGTDWYEFMDQFEPMEGETTAELDDIWTIVFTSGTTGTPKGVVLTYGALQSTEQVIEDNNHLQVSLEGDNQFFSFLPLNHIAERVVVENTCFKYGGIISFAESLETFAKNLQETQPSLFFAVPRIWTKFQLGVLAKMPQKRLNLLLSLPIISGIVKKKLKAGLGMTNVRGCLTGAASIPESTKNWFRRLDIPIAEGYGMTENCALCSCLEAKDILPGSVGKALPGATIKIHPETKEILMKAPYVMRGYYKDAEKTAETIQDGWLHTGDQGRLDENGNLFITGRVKDTFKTAKGKFIAPAPIEWHFAQDADIEQICILGLGCPQPVALVVPSEIGMAKPKETLKEGLQSTLQQVNKQLPNYQKVSTIIVAKDAWSIENGFLTPTLKVKRNVLGQRYKDLLMSWHEDQEAVLWE
ncbi:MAG: AMP-binding protein [Saprospiraceae bacterium]|nr:AMP-binding protein [Saprospiraceae bacterium]